MIDLHEANGARFYAGDDMIVRWCREKRKDFEPETTKWLFERLDERPEGLFVDVGAATGWFSIPVALRGREVVSIEANRRVFERLTGNAALNRAPISAYNVAASDKRGKATFMFNHRLPLTSGGSLEAPSSVDYRTEEVPTERLDDIVTAPVAVMKIDVEGHEPAVLKGAARIIRESRPFLVLEANDAEHEAALAQWCVESGYAWSPADERNMLCSPAS